MIRSRTNKGGDIMQINRIYIKGHGFCPIIAIIDNNYHVLLPNMEIVKMEVVSWVENLT